LEFKIELLICEYEDMIVKVLLWNCDDNGFVDTYKHYMCLT